MGPHYSSVQSTEGENMTPEEFDLELNRRLDIFEKYIDEGFSVTVASHHASLVSFSPFQISFRKHKRYPGIMKKYKSRKRPKIKQYPCHPNALLNLADIQHKRKNKAIKINSESLSNALDILMNEIKSGSGIELARKKAGISLRVLAVVRDDPRYVKCLDYYHSMRTAELKRKSF